MVSILSYVQSFLSFPSPIYFDFPIFSPPALPPLPFFFLYVLPLFPPSFLPPLLSHCSPTPLFFSADRQLWRRPWTLHGASPTWGPRPAPSPDKVHQEGASVALQGLQKCMKTPSPHPAQSGVVDRLNKLSRGSNLKRWACMFAHILWHDCTTTCCCFDTISGGC